MLRRISQYLLGISLLAAQETVPAKETAPPAQAPAGMDRHLYDLARIKLRMSQNLLRLPNYTCIQTIERSRRRARSRRFELVDTLRLEVALVGGKEMFSWPGAGKFEDKELREIVGTGAIGNGNFALHARSIFLSNAPRFEFDQKIFDGSAGLLRYRYRVPRFLSGYHLRYGEAEGIAGYYGHFDVNAETLDLQTLEVLADEIPTTVPLMAASDRVRYARVRIGEGEFLLPQSSEMTLVGLDGSESRNRVNFSNCHQYSGESVISFADPPPEAAAPAPIAALIVLPMDLYLDFRLNAAVDPEKIIIGEELGLTLGADTKVRGKVIVPRGARAVARVVSFERMGGREQIYKLELRLGEITWDSVKAHGSAVVVEVGPLIRPSPAAGVDKQGIIYISGLRPALLKGSRLVWRTTIVQENP